MNIQLLTGYRMKRTGGVAGGQCINAPSGGGNSCSIVGVDTRKRRKGLQRGLAPERTSVVARRFSAHTLREDCAAMLEFMARAGYVSGMIEVVGLGHGFGFVGSYHAGGLPWFGRACGHGSRISLRPRLLDHL